MIYTIIITAVENVLYDISKLGTRIYYKNYYIMFLSHSFFRFCFSYQAPPLVLNLKLLSTFSRYYFNMSYGACKIVDEKCNPEIHKYNNTVNIKYIGHK